MYLAQDPNVRFAFYFRDAGTIQSIEVSFAF